MTSLITREPRNGNISQISVGLNDVSTPSCIVSH